MPDEKKDLRVTFMMSASELQRLDDWAFEARIRSRGEAIRRLLAEAVADSRDVVNRKVESGVGTRTTGNKT